MLPPIEEGTKLMEAVQLSGFTGLDSPSPKEIVSERGHVREQTIENFLAAGYRKDQPLEIRIGVALTTISNYLDHISPNELDPAFRSEG